MRAKFSPTFVLLQCLAFVASSAQTADHPDVLARVTSLSDSGAYTAVVELLEPFVERHPSSAEAWRLLAQHRYWSRDLRGARSTYEKALRRHPSNADLRLSYARFLMENGEADRAAEVLRPLGSDNAEAEAIRGTIAWWAGDLTQAARYFKSALSTTPDHAEAASALASIRGGARPWIRVGGEGGADSQPLSKSGASAEAGFFITPLQTLRAELTHTRFATRDSVRPVTFASAGLRGFLPAAKLETDVAAGVISRTDSTDWTARLDAGFRLPYGLRAGARWERKPYLYTAASISEDVMTTAMQVHVSADKSGWLGEAALGHERFPDDNGKAMIYGWFMAPVLRTEGLWLQAGYAYGYQNTAEHRYTPVITNTPGPARPPTWEGRYDPYYTPLNQHTHSVTGSIALWPSRILTVRANGSYGIFGSEDTPFVYLAGRAPMTGVYNHAIHPWNARGSIAAAVSPMVTIQLEGSHMATTWYDASTLTLSVYVRL